MKKLGLFALLLVFVKPVAADVEHIGNLRQGMVLYEYYQRNYFNALSQLQIAEQQQPFESFSHQAQLLEGSISLLFGLEQQAADTLTRLLTRQSSLDAESRNTAWLYLAKLHHLQGNYGLAARRLDKMQPPRNRRDDALIELRDERYALMIDIAVRQNYLDIAQSHLSEWNPKPSMPWAYAQFNLASAFAREGEFESALSHYKAITQLAPVYDVFRDREFLGLYDKALVNSGYSRLRLAQYDQAIIDFKKVRQQGDNTAQALMAWGWAEQLRAQPQRAVQPWQALVNMPEGERYQQSALLGLPGLYEEMEQFPLAVTAYENAEAAFEAALKNLAELTLSVQGQEMQSLLHIDAVESFAAGDFLRQVDTSRTMLSPWLYRLEASAEFQAIRHDLASIIAMEQLLDEWRYKFDIWRDVLAKRSQQRAQHKTNIEAQQFVQLHQDLRAQHAELDASLKADIQQHNFFAFVPKDKQTAVKRIARAEQNVETLSQHGKRTQFHQQRLARVKGVLLWQAADNASSAIRGKQKQLAETQRLLATFNQHIVALDTKLAAAPDITPFEQRIDSLAANLQSVELALQEVKQEKDALLRDMMLQEVLALEKKVGRYLLAARLSLARIYDASLEQQL